MKKLFLLLILPAFLGAQPKEHYYNATFLSGTVSNFIVPEIEHKYPNLYGIVNDTIERLISTKIHKENLNSARDLQKPSSYIMPSGELPTHLITFSVIPPYETENLKSQKQSNKLVMIDDVVFPKQNTLFPWLKAVDTGKPKMSGPMNNFQGFGPIILF